MPQRVVRSWENGNVPLSTVPYGQLIHMANALDRHGANFQGSLDQLLAAIQCDVLISGMLGGDEDYADVPPIDDESAWGTIAGALLRWAICGLVPADYSRFAAARPLLAESDISGLASVAKLLSALPGQGPELANYGMTLQAIFVAHTEQGSCRNRCSG